MRIQYFLLVLVLIRNLRCFKHNQSSFVSMQRGAVQGNVPAERSYPNTKRMGKVMLHILVFLSAICGTGVFMDKAVKAVDFPATILHSSHVNVMPTEDFWYPPYTIGSWDTELIFKGAKFTDKVTIEELTTGDAIPGFKKYSVFFVPNVGMDASRMARRYVQLDSHPREDHSHNIRQLVAAFSPETVVDSAAYSYQSSTALFNSPGNVWNIKYHDKDGEGDIELRTTKRNIDVYAGTLETTEHFSQKHTRRKLSGSGVREAQPVAQVTLGDYALNWKLSVPASGADTFVTVSDLSSSNSLVGELNIFAYPQPTSNLYLKIPEGPAAVFTYQVKMHRIGSVDEATKNTVYPFVSRRVGPVELRNYFGY